MHVDVIRRDETIRELVDVTGTKMDDWDGFSAPTPLQRGFFGHRSVYICM